MDCTQILFVNACVRPNSRTRELAECLLDKLSGDVSEIDLYAENIRPLDLGSMAARKEAMEKGDFDHPDFRYARQLASADIIVIAAPYWDLLFPAVVRDYLEATTINGVTFRYSEQGRPIGLCRAKRVYYVTTAGGYPGEDHLGFIYVKSMANAFYGIGDVRLISAEGLDIAGADVEGIMRAAKAAITGA